MGSMRAGAPGARRFTRAILLTSALGLGLIVSAPALAADECGPAPGGGGTVTCTTAANPYSDGVTYTPPADLTVVLDPGVSIDRTTGGAADDALSINVTGVDANVGVFGSDAQVQAGTGLRDGISITHDYGSTGTTTIDLNGVAYGQRRGINVYGGGDVYISTYAAYGGSAGGAYGGDGIHVEGLSPGSSVYVGANYAASNNGSGIRVFGAVNGDVRISGGLMAGTAFGVVGRAYGAGGVHIHAGYAIGGTGSAILASSYGGDVYVGASIAKSSSTSDAAIDVKTFGSGSIEAAAGTVSAVRSGVSATAYGTGGVHVEVGAVVSTARTGVYAYSHGGDVTVDVGTYAVGARAGVAAISSDGDVAVNIAPGGIVGATGDYGDAIYAASNHGAININAAGAYVAAVGVGTRGVDALGGTGQDVNITVGAVVTTGASAPGYDTDAIRARAYGTGAINITAYTAATVGAYSEAIDAKGDGPVSVTAAYALATGYADRAIDAYSTNGPVNVVVALAAVTQDYSDAIAARSGSGDVTVTAAVVAAPGYDGHGIIAHSFGGGDVTVNMAQAVSYAEAVTAETSGAGDVSVNVAPGGAIVTTGYYGAGIAALAETGSIDINAAADSTITTIGSDAQGVYATAYGPGAININVGAVVTTGLSTASHQPTGIYAHQTGSGAINITAGTVATLGDYAYGIEARAGTGAIDITSGNVLTSGYGADAIHAFGGSGVSITTTGLVGTLGDYAWGISAETPGHAIIDNQGEVDTSGAGAVGIGAVTVDGKIDITSNKVVSEKFTGIYATSTHGGIAINAADTTSHGSTTSAILAIGGANVSVHAGSATATGYTATAIDARSTGGNTVVTALDVNSEGSGISAISSVGSTRVDLVSVQSYYDGVLAQADLGPVSVGLADGGLVHTTGYGGRGVAALSGAGPITITGGDGSRILTEGSNAPGVFASTAGDISVDVDTVSTSGALFAAGIQANGLGSGGVSLSSRSVTTAGSFSDGIAASAVSGPIDITSGDVSTSGAFSDAINAAGGSSISITTTGATTATGLSSSGVSAFSNGPVSIDNAGTIQVSGAGGSGISALSFGGDVSVTSNRVSSQYSKGIDALGGGAVSVNAASTTSNGLNGIAISAVGLGDVAVTAGQVTATGAGGIGVYALSYAGAAAVQARQVSATGFGVLAAAAHGDAAAVLEPGGSAVAVGPSAYGIKTLAISGSATANTSGASVSAAGSQAVGVSAVSRAAGSAAILAGRTVVSGQYSLAVFAKAAQGDASITAQSTSASGDFSTGVLAWAVQGDASITAQSASASGRYAQGVRAQASGDASITAGDVTEVGDNGVGVSAVGGDAPSPQPLLATGNAVVVTTGTVSAEGASAVGVAGLAGGGDISVTSNVVRVSGAGALGVKGRSLYGGNVSITATDVSVAGAGATGILGRAYGNGTLTITSGDVYASATASDTANAIDARGHSSISITTTGATTVVGVLGNGIRADSSGSVTIDNLGAVHAAGLGAAGIYATSSSAITIGSQTAVAGDGFGIEARGTGPITINAASTTTNGDGFDAILALGGGDVSVTAGSVSADHFVSGGIAAFSQSGHVTLQAAQVSAYGTGVFVANGSGASNTLSLGDVTSRRDAVIAGAGADLVNISAGSTVRGGAGVGVWFLNAASATLDNAGTLTSDSGVAILSDVAPVTVNNTGSVIGGVFLAGAADSFNNAAGGTFAAVDSDFGGGADVLANAGTVALAGAGTPVSVTFAGLEQFDNAGGLVDLRGRGAGDELTLPGAFNATGSSRLAVDAFLGGTGSIADVLKVNGAITGSTAVTVQDTNAGPGAFNPTGILLVDASGGAGTPAASAFTLAGGPIVKGLWRYDLYLKPDKTFVLASLPSATAFNTPYLASALQGLFGASLLTLDDRLDDLRTLQFASTPVRLAALASDAGGRLPAGGGKDNGVWARVVGGHESRDASQTVSLLGVSTTYNLDYKQSYVAFQSGFDHTISRGPDTFVFGASLGYANSNGDFDAGGSFQLNGLTAAGYAEYMRGGFFGHVVGQGEWLTLDYKSAAGSAKPHTQTYGISAGAGYRVQQGVWFVEPDASLDWADTSVDAFTLQGANVTFRDGEMLRGRAKLNIGEVLYADHGGMRIEPTVSAGVAKAFEGGASADVASGPGVTLSDNGRPTWGEFAFGVRVIDLGSGLSGFVKGQYDGLSNEYSGYSFKAGLKVRF